MKRLLLLISPILLIMLIFYLFRSNILIVKFIDVQAEKITCADSNQIRDSIKIIGQNFFLINSQKVEDDLKKKFLCVSSVKLSKYLPNKVKLQIFEREPAAILLSIKSEEATNSAVLEKFKEATEGAKFNFSYEGPAIGFLVDSEGVIYSANIEQQTSPKIYVDGVNLTLGQRIKDLLANTLKILEKVKTFAVDVKEAKIYSRDTLLINAIPKIIFRLDDKIDTQLASLQLILNQAKIDEANLEFIDLRFDKPMVRLAPKKK